MPTMTNADLEMLIQASLEKKSVNSRLGLLQAQSSLQKFLENSTLRHVIGALTGKQQYLAFALLSIGQEHLLTHNGKIIPKEKLIHLLKQLEVVEEFYEEMGGLLGYHMLCLKLLAQKKVREKKGIYHVPEAQNIAVLSSRVQKSIIDGICNLPYLAQIFPVGGAADRLSFRDEITGAFQIAATLEFAQKNLLEWLIEDLQALEYLYWKLYDKPICIPIVLMSSDEKKGTEHLKCLLEERNWFGRKKDSFFLFAQPLVPTMTPEGMWCTKGPYELLLKPGGHGVIWKLAKQSGALKWLTEKGKTKSLVRQINNVIAGTDYGLLSFLGLGFSQDKDFGFASCPREEGVSEGVNVLIESNLGYALTNIEYCDLEHFAVEGENLLANTNLLFADLETIDELVDKCPIPGMLVNAKKMKYRNHLGNIDEEEVLRLESTMQNIADALVEEKPLVRSYITCNKRKKTISPIKKEFAFGSSMLQTPEQCYLDLLTNSRDLLENYCGFEVPSMRDPLSFFLSGPPFIFLYHPALGPQYEVISQKVFGGKLAMGSEMILRIADLQIKNLDLDGSLHISTDCVMGHHDHEGKLLHSNQTGKCTLKNVKIRNLGIHQEASRSFWKDEIVHKERCEIILEEGSEFFAENIVIRGNVSLRVACGTKVIAQMEGGRLVFHQEVLESPSWAWAYSVNASNQIKLKKDFHQ